MKIAKVEFEMEFDDKFTAKQIINYLEFTIGKCGTLAFEDQTAGDLEPIRVVIDVI